MSIIFVIWQNISTLWPPALSFGRRVSRRRSFPASETNLDISGFCILFEPRREYRPCIIENEFGHGDPYVCSEAGTVLTQLRELCHIRGLWPASNPPSSKRRIQTSSSASSCRRTHPPLEHSSCTGGACAVVKRKCATCIVGVISCSRRDALATSCPSHSRSISPTRQGSTISGILPFLCPGISTLSTPCSPAPPPSSSGSRHMTHRRAISREEMVIFANHRCAGDAHAKNDTSPSDNPASRTQLIPPPCSSARRTAKRATCAALAAAANAAPFRLLPNSSTAGVTEGNVKAVGGNVESCRASTDHGLRSVVRMQVREPALILRHQPRSM
mmetsp:Transcript_77881/g.113956  ORF Transcript_77881/g.113956 Transcript_77881/m.113956 type:complete len:330 (+) Transcript_77881:1566-2555(+)